MNTADIPRIVQAILEFVWKMVMILWVSRLAREIHIQDELNAIQGKINHNVGNNIEGIVEILRKMTGVEKTE